LKAGITLDGTSFLLTKVLFLCDTPARCSVQSIKAHGGFYGCGYCQQKAERYLEHTIFPLTNYQRRTDEGYASFTENNQIGVSPLFDVVPFFSCFPPDPMHMIYLGVTCKLLHYYFTTSKGLKLACKLPCNRIAALSSRICLMRQSFPRSLIRA
jgi:hypothetical protein